MLIISLLWSIKTAATTYIKIKTEEKMELFTIGSKSVLGVRSLLVYATRILFFGPSLGLLDCLAHWWAVLIVYQEFFHPWRRILAINQQPENQEPEVH